jgi:hypothetical protein
LRRRSQGNHLTWRRIDTPTPTAGSPGLASVIPIRACASPSPPKARAGCGHAARPDLWGVLSDGHSYSDSPSEAARNGSWIGRWGGDSARGESPERVALARRQRPLARACVSGGGRRACRRGRPCRRRMELHLCRTRSFRIFLKAQAVAEPALNGRVLLSATGPSVAPSPTTRRMERKQDLAHILVADRRGPADASGNGGLEIPPHILGSPSWAAIRFFGRPSPRSRRTSLTSIIVILRYIHALVPGHGLRPETSIARSGERGKGFEKVVRKGSLCFENHSPKVSVAGSFAPPARVSFAKRQMMTIPRLRCHIAVSTIDGRNTSAATRVGVRSTPECGIGAWRRDVR